ncbi:hypothetical protein K432DRAFT_382131 [Lepidopterella palustris CBS 459.81]|uniref:Uncharacterized protein n=1 Tax=Lepidopterella palustris CBS 459.81 TaxID=1314670 RepID=A0A8E2EAK8_9PEZI|nr:hypothetical protein K432DRAFT_382131 [Lepidopterella palustris CBS 459.81]
MDPSDIEILVHISAPATRRNEDRYRAQALAYLEFESYDPTYVRSKDLGNEEQKAHPETLIIDGPSTPSLATTPKSAVASSAIHDSRISSSSLPTGTHTKPDALAELPGTDSFGSFPSNTSIFGSGKVQKVIGEGFGPGFEKSDGPVHSSKKSLDQLEYIQAQWRKNQYASIPSSSKYHHASNERRDVPEIDPATFLEDTQLAVAALQSDIFNSFSLSDQSEIIPSRIEERPSKRPCLSQASSPNSDTRLVRGGDIEDPISAFISSLDVQKPPHMTSSGGIDTLPPSSLPAYEDGHSRESKLQLVLDTYTNQIFSSPSPENPNTQDVIPMDRNQPAGKQINRPESVRSLNMTQTTAKTPDFESLPCEVFPPPPKVPATRTSSWPSQITEKLAILRDLPENSGRFRPRKMMRTPAVDEQGYWKVETGGWPLDRQYKFWRNLSESVRRGDFGWGVTLHREPSEDDGDVNRLGLVRLYCWGELVEHTYLYLWLSSSGVILKDRLQWIDADNIVVVQM